MKKGMWGVGALALVLITGLSVFYRAQVGKKVVTASTSVNGQELPIIIFTDDSAFTVIKVLVTPGAVNDSNKIAVLESINEMNRSYKLFKYLVSEKDIELEYCNLSRDDFFDPQVIHISLDIILEHLQKEYPKLMQMIWGSAGSVDQ